MVWLNSPQDETYNLSIQTNVPVAIRPSSSVHLMLFPNIPRIISIAELALLAPSLLVSNAVFVGDVDAASVVAVASVIFVSRYGER